MLEQGDQIGETLMKGEHIGAVRLGKTRVDAIEDRVRDLMRDNVMGEGGEDNRPGHIVAILAINREVTEQQGLLMGAVIGVTLPQRMRIDPQPSDKLPFVLFLAALGLRCPFPVL